MNETAAPQSNHVEQTIDSVITTVKDGKTTDFFRSLWENNQNELVHFGKLVLLTILVLFLTKLFLAITKKLIYKSTEKFAGLDQTAGKILFSIARAIILIFTFLIILELFGINTASILTVLGAAGLAVGLAMKDSLSNIAAGLMLQFLRPFKVGDYIDCGAISGTIADMGLFTTELKTIDGMFIAAPNSVLFGSPIKNYSRNPLRRADIVVGIAYEDDVLKAVEVLTAMLKQTPSVLQDPAPEVLISDLADSSVNLTLRFWANNADYWTAFWAVKNNLKGTIEGAGLNIPFPQRVVTMVPPKANA